MRIILCCLGLLFAAPALASSVEEGLCHARSQPVETMEQSEKLCRAFVRALGKLPGETMKKVPGKVQKRPGPHEPPSLPLPAPVTAGAPAVSSAGVIPGVVPGTGVAPALAGSGSRSTGGQAPTQSTRPKKVDLKAFKEWLGKAKRRPAREKPEAYRYQRKHAGPEEIQVSGGGEEVWADGARLEKARLLEVKHVSDAERSPFIPGSKCGDTARTMILDAITDEFARYAAVIKDPDTPVIELEVIINDTRAAPLFEALMKKFGIPGEVVVRP